VKISPASIGCWQHLCVNRCVPSAEAILAGLTTIANEWWTVAVFWHAYVAVLLLAIAMGWALFDRRLGTLLALPLLSVSALAWASHNPFNGALCATLSLVLLTIARRLGDARVTIASWPSVLAGGALVAFGWTYPHFLETKPWSLYVIAAPLGLLPCPTLSALSGLTLIVSGFRSTAWNVTLAGAALLYGAIGVFHLAVTMDIALFAGATALVAAVAIRRRSPQPINA
jgi:hypothetical protein